MKILFSLIFFAVAAAGAETPKYSPLDGAVAVPLSLDNSYFRNPAVPAYDYWNLSSFYLPQFKGYSVSAASLAMALNALLNTRRQRGDEEKNIEPLELAEKMPLLSHGVTLTQLARVSREALAAYGAADFSVSVTTVAARTAQTLESFRTALAGNERDPGNIMLLHFAQALVTGAPGGPYATVSPVGAYDEKTRRVLIFDVDRQWYEPYWAADIQVFKAMALKTEKYGHGGYVVLKAGK